MPAPPPVTLTGAPLFPAPALPAFHHGPALCLTDTPPSTGVFMLMDATHVPIEKYGDPTWNRLTFSGKVGAATYNTNALSDPGGLMLWISPSVPGSVHDIRLLREYMPDFGYLTDIMMAGPPGDARPVLVVDKGYLGAQKLLLGTCIMIPIKRRMGSDEGGGLSQKDRDHNRAVAQVRYVVEQCMGRIKLFGMMRGPYRGTPDRFNGDMNVVAGLANLRHLREHIRAAHADTIREVTAWRRRG